LLSFRAIRRTVLTVALAITWLAAGTARSAGPAVAITASRAQTLPQCEDGIDNDGDGLVDHPSDPGCAGTSSNLENPACQDGIDNDGDGKTDFDGGASAHGGVAVGPPDAECSAAARRSERVSCGLGVELVFVLPLLLWQHRRRAARSGL
jgi:hypothetical protein